MSTTPPFCSAATKMNSKTLPSTYNACYSDPCVSAPPSPTQTGYFYSAPSSPMQLPNSTMTSTSSTGAASFEFEFGDDDRSSTMSSADELFLNGQIRPMKLSSHLQRPQNLAPLIGAEMEVVRGRDSKMIRDGSLRRKARSLSPLRSTGGEEEEKESSKTKNNRWVFLKDIIRSKRDRSSSFWSPLSFSHQKAVRQTQKELSKRGRSAHEAHYTAKRAQAEEMRRRTFLPYRQGLLGCLGFSSKGYGAVNGLAKALNSVSSR